MVYDNSHIRSHVTSRLSGFTMVEVIVAIALIGIGLATTIGVLTKLNSFASSNRSSTGAYAAVMNQIDLIKTATPFNPEKGQIPPVLANGTQVRTDIPIYTDLREDGTGQVEPTTPVVVGKLTTEIVDISKPGTPMYRATVKVEYPFPNPRHSFSMSTIRVSDQ